MRAAVKPRSSARVSSSPSPQVAYLRALVALGASIGLLLVWWPSVVRAQRPSSTSASGGAPTIHVVAPGETLWALAERYYGDGRSWPTLAARNDVDGEARKPLPNGRKLLIPARPNSALAPEPAHAVPTATVASHGSAIPAVAKPVAPKPVAVKSPSVATVRAEPAHKPLATTIAALPAAQAAARTTTVSTPAKASAPAKAALKVGALPTNAQPAATRAPEVKPIQRTAVASKSIAMHSAVARTDSNSATGKARHAIPVVEKAGAPVQPLASSAVITAATAAAQRDVMHAQLASPEPSAPRAAATLAAQTTGKGDAAPPVRVARSVAPTVAHGVARSVAVGVTARPVVYSVPRRVSSAPPRLVPPAARQEAPGVMPDTVDDAKMVAPSRGHLGIGASSPSDPELSRPATRIGLVSQADLAAARGANEPATVFIRYVPDQSEVDASARAINMRQTPTWRRGEFEAAPFAIPLRDAAKAGRITRRIGAAAAGSLGGQPRVLLADEVEVSAPTGLTLKVGDRLISANVDRVLSKESRIAVPSGVLIVTRAEAGKPAVALVQRQSDMMELGQAVFVDEATPPTAHLVADAPLGREMEARVIWASELAAMPSLQSFVLLSAGSAQGVRVGDEFALAKRTGIGAAARDERVAVARVVRSGPEGSSAIIVRQSSADIAVGEPAFRVARVP